MPLSNASNTQLAPRAIAEMAWTRLYDTFPLNLVTRATGPRGFVYPVTSATTGTVNAVNEAAAQASENTFQPAFTQKTPDLDTFRASITVSNELLNDSKVMEFVAARLAGQIAERVGEIIVGNIATVLLAESRYTAYDHFDVGVVNHTAGTARIEAHSGFACLSELHNTYRSRASWIFSPTGFRNWGTQEGRSALVTLGIRTEDFQYGKGIGLAGASGAAAPWWVAGAAMAGGGGGNNVPPGGPVGEEELSALPTLEKRSRLVTQSPTADSWHTAYLGCPIYTSNGLAATHNQSDEAWAILADLTAYLHFDQPLTVTLDTEKKMVNNQTVIHAAYRADGAFMEPTAGWALVSPA